MQLKKKETFKDDTDKPKVINADFLDFAISKPKLNRRNMSKRNKAHFSSEEDDKK